MSTLREIIYENVCEGELYEKLDRNWVRCFACGHCCKIPDGQPGVCKVRYIYVKWNSCGKGSSTSPRRMCEPGRREGLGVSIDLRERQLGIAQ